ncbi:MAG: two-component system cell cycle response regulator [Planctomycetota bacterium]
MLQQKFDELRLTGSLPSPSAIGLRVLELAQNDEYDHGELVRTILGDPALAGRILKLANSATHAAAGPVETIAQATMRIGATSVRHIALGLTLVSDNRSGNAQGFDYDRFWLRSLATAVSASTLAFELNIMGAAEAFTVGLLCDVGKLALASVHPEKYSAMLERQPFLEDSFLAPIETRVFGINHTEVSALMMEDWRLPKSAQYGVLRHMGVGAMGDEISAEACSLSLLLQAAKSIADVMILDRQENRTVWLRACFQMDRCAKDLGLEPEALRALGDKILPAWRDWSFTMGLSRGKRMSFKDAFREIEKEGIVECPAPLALQQEPNEKEGSEILTGVIDTIATSEKPTSIEKPLRILVIDDEAQMLRLISHYLRREGYEVIEATSSEEGLREAFSKKPQVVISDWGLPGMSGIELCSTLRETEAGKKIYMLIVTAREDDEQVVEAFSKGVDDYIVKPFNPKILIARVRAGQRMVRMRERVEESERAQQRQVASLGILTRKLRAAALTDPLTRLPNRRYAMKRLKQEWDVAERLGKPLSVAVGDIDFFKRVNDDYGHDAGDAVLRMVAAEMRRTCRSGDVLARVGGEEFLLIHTGGNQEMAAASADRIRQAVEALEIHHEGVDLKVTLSFGVAQRADDMCGLDDLIKVGDQALYQAKEQGRNQVCIQNEGQAPPPAIKRPA